MPGDRLLTTVLRALQGAPDPEQTNRILSSTTSLLTTLSNPLNVTILTSQLLTAPAIWNPATELSTCLRIISIYNTAAITVHRNKDSKNEPHDAYQPRQGGGISCDDWARAVVKGADDRSARWQHTLVIAGVLLGMEGQERQGLSRGLRATLEGAVVTAANLALGDPTRTGTLGIEATVLALNHTFPFLSDHIRRGLNYDALVVVMIQAMTSGEGYEGGQFLQSINFDIREVLGSKLDWPAKSASFLRIQKMASKPLVSSMGPFSRLAAHAIENAQNPLLSMEALQRLEAFTSSVLASWQMNKLSQIDPSEENAALSPETLQVTFPVLWQVLKTAMFATVVVLRAIVGRTLIDGALANKHAPAIASQCLIILRNLHFISSRTGSSALSAYTFVNMASVDILCRHSRQSKAFLRKIYPVQAGQIPANPLQRNLDLFYLNTSEHFTLALQPADNEALIVTPASPYLNPVANSQHREIFEAAHSAMLAVLAAPHNNTLTAKTIPFYVDSLFRSFPTNLSPRQFRLAFKTLMQVATPPSPLSASQPLLSETLLEMIHHRALHAPTIPMASLAEVDSPLESNVPLSEQATLLLTLLDALPSLPLPILETWLPLAAHLLHAIPDSAMREHCKARFWELLESGEMDVDRSAVCVGWWTTQGGREMVLYGRVENDNKDPAGPFMSGALLAKGERDGNRL